MKNRLETPVMQQSVPKILRMQPKLMNKYGAVGPGTGEVPGAGWRIGPPMPIPSATHLPIHGTVRWHILFKDIMPSHLPPLFRVPWRDSGEPLVAQFSGAWTDGGVTILMQDSNNPFSNTLADAINRSAHISVTEQTWPTLDQHKIIVVVTSRLSVATKTVDQKQAR